MAAEQTIYENLRDRLIIGEFEPGQRLQPEKLRSNYQTSASTIRETLLRLSTAGLVDFIEQRGFRMPQQSAALRHELIRTCILLECEGASLSIRHGGVLWEARLIAANHELSHVEAHLKAMNDVAGLLPAWLDKELKFHQVLIEECGSTTLKEIHLQLHQRCYQQLISHDKQMIFSNSNSKQHEDILEAVLKHDESLVCQYIQAHLTEKLSPGTNK